LASISSLFRKTANTSSSAATAAAAAAVIFPLSFSASKYFDQKSFSDIYPRRMKLGEKECKLETEEDKKSVTSCSCTIIMELALI
jgi:hypothetical protein